MFYSPLLASKQASTREITAPDLDWWACLRCTPRPLCGDSQWSAVRDEFLFVNGGGPLSVICNVI